MCRGAVGEVCGVSSGIGSVGERRSWQWLKEEELGGYRVERYSRQRVFNVQYMLSENRARTTIYIALLK